MLRNRSSWRGGRSKRPVNHSSSASSHLSQQEKKSSSHDKNLETRIAKSKSNVSQTDFNEDTSTSGVPDYLSGTTPIPEHCWVGEYLDGEDIATQKSEIELKNEMYEKEVKTDDGKESNISFFTTDSKQVNYNPVQQTKRRGILKNSSQYKPKSSLPLSTVKQHPICIEYDHGNRKFKQTLSDESRHNNDSDNYDRVLNKSHSSTQRNESLTRKRKSTAWNSTSSFDYSQQDTERERRDESTFSESKELRSLNTFKNKVKQNLPLDAEQEFSTARKSHQKEKALSEAKRTHVIDKNPDQVGLLRKRKIDLNYYVDDDDLPFPKKKLVNDCTHEEDSESSRRFLTKDNHDNYRTSSDIRMSILPKTSKYSFYDDQPEQPILFQCRDRSSSPFDRSTTLKIKPIFKTEVSKQQNHRLQYSDSRTVQQNSSELKSDIKEQVQNFAHFNDTRRVLCDESKVKHDQRYDDAGKTDSFSKTRRVVHGESKSRASVLLNFPDFDKTQPDISHQQFSRTVDKSIVLLSHSIKESEDQKITFGERFENIYRGGYQELPYKQGHGGIIDNRSSTEDVEEDTNISENTRGSFEEHERFSTVLHEEGEQDKDYAIAKLYSPISESEDYQLWDEMKEEFFGKRSSGSGEKTDKTEAKVKARSVMKVNERGIDATENKELWMKEYDAWFHKFMYHRLQEAIATRNSDLCDPLVFLDSVARGERRSISCIPKGKEAKDLLRFVSMSKKQVCRKSTPVSLAKKKSEIIFHTESSTRIDLSPGMKLQNVQNYGKHIEDSKAAFLKSVSSAKRPIKIMPAKGKPENQIKVQEKASPHGKLLILKEEKNGKSLRETIVKESAKNESEANANEGVRGIALEKKATLEGQMVEDRGIIKTAESSDRKNIIKKYVTLEGVQNDLCRKSSNKVSYEKRPEAKPEKECVSTLKESNDALQSGKHSNLKSENKAKPKEESTRIFPNIILKKATERKHKEKRATDNSKLFSQKEHLREKEKDVTTFKREIERSVCRVLNLRYGFESYDKDKVNLAAKDALHAFERRNKNAAKFSMEEALQNIKMIFKNPTRSSLDEIKRRMERENVKEHCFVTDIAAFKKFKECVFRLCQKDLTHKHHSQSEDDLRYVVQNGELLFPQFCNTATTIIKVWFWHQAVLKVSPRLTDRNAVQIFSGGGYRSIYDQISYWLKMVLPWPLHKVPEHIGHNVVTEVQFQLGKFGKKYSFVSALDMVIDSQMSRYFDEMQKNFKLSSQSNNAKSEEGKHMDQLIVLDEVYSDDSDTEQGSKEEYEVDTCDQMSVSSNVPTIDLF